MFEHASSDKLNIQGKNKNNEPTDYIRSTKGRKEKSQFNHLAGKQLTGSFCI